MKTFEEQFTAWVDDCLPADEHAAFERVLAARPDADALRAERRAAGRLRNLLRENLHAPTLPSPDFFNHGIMERIAAEGRAVETAPRRRTAWWQWDWTPVRLLAAGAACLLTAMVGVRNLIPTTGNGPAVQPAIARNDTPRSLPSPTVAPAPDLAPAPRGPGSTDDGQQVKLEVHPPVMPVEPSPGVPPPRSDSAVTATPLHFDEGDADVIWLDGTDYLPNLEGATTPAPAAAAPR